MIKPSVLRTTHGLSGEADYQNRAQRTAGLCAGQLPAAVLHGFRRDPGRYSHRHSFDDIKSFRPADTGSCFAAVQVYFDACD